MRLEPLYQQDREQAIQQGEQRVIIRLLNRCLGEINTSLTKKIQELSTEQLERLTDALLNFSEIADLENWLNHL